MNDRIQSCKIEIRVRYGEVDRMGVVHHSRYWTYFEIGRTELLRLQGLSYKKCEENGVYFVVVKCSARFHAAGHYDDVLLLDTHVAKVGQARIDHTYELKRKSDGRLLTTGQTTIASVTREGKVIPIPELIRNYGNAKNPCDNAE